MDLLFEPLIFAVGAVLLVLCLSVSFILLVAVGLPPCRELFAPFIKWNNWRKRRKESLLFNLADSPKQS